MYENPLTARQNRHFVQKDIIYIYFYIYIYIFYIYIFVFIYIIPQTALANGVLTMFDLKGIDRPNREIAWLSGLGGFQKSSIFLQKPCIFSQKSCIFFQISCIFPRNQAYFPRNHRYFCRNHRCFCRNHRYCWRCSGGSAISNLMKNTCRSCF